MNSCWQLWECGRKSDLLNGLGACSGTRCAPGTPCTEHNSLNILHATKLFTLTWFMLCYVNFTSVGKRRRRKMGQARRGCCGQKMQGVQSLEGTLLPTFRGLCSPVSDPSSGSGGRQMPQEVAGQHTGPTSSPPSARGLSFPRLEAVRFRWERPRPEVPGSPRHRAALAASKPSQEPGASPGVLGGKAPGRASDPVTLPCSGPDFPRLPGKPLPPPGAEGSR